MEARIQPRPVVRIAHQCEKLVLEVIPKTQHRPIAIKINAAVSPQEVPFRRRYNLKKEDWEGFAKSDDMGIIDIVPTPDNYICGLTDESKELYEDYKIQLENDPFNSEPTETGNRLSDEIAEAQQKK